MTDPQELFHGIQSLGVMNALKTGDPRTDMFVALCLPFALRYIVELTKALAKYCNWKYWKNWWWGHEEPTIYHERAISHTSRQNSYGETINMDEDSHNSVLIKAIRLYCHANVDFNLRKADLTLTNMECEEGLYFGQSIVSFLMRYKMVKNPPEKQWHRLGVFGDEKKGMSPVQLSIDSESKDRDDSEEETKSKTRTTKYTLRSLEGSALDAFLDTAYNWYIDELRNKEDHHRYYYDLEAKTSDDTAAQRYYKRFRLSEEKTFESLFFQEKSSILKLVDDFMEKKGKYSIKGYPHKLGMLLTGPPGTGKTSLIKALAQHTGRSIVNVPLSKISTNAEFMSQLYDKTYRVKGEISVRLDFKDVIFCLEDLDAASDIVKRRDGKTRDDENASTAAADALVTSDMMMDHVPTPNKSLWEYFLESSEETCQALVKQLIEKSPRLKEQAKKAYQLLSVADCIADMRPGLGLVGSDHPVLKKMGQEAVKTATDKLSSDEEVDKFLGGYAKKMKRLLESGAEIDDAVVDSLLSSDTVCFAPSTALTIPKSPSSNSTEETAMFDSDSSDSWRDSYRSGPPSSNNSNNGDYRCNAASGDNKKKNKSSNMMLPRSSSWYRPPDALNLTGILNALDGVVDCPGRIVIMTTNHPEKLDKALIRPGRIDKQLYLGYMAAEDICNMLEHYFQTDLDDGQREQIEEIVNGSPEISHKRLGYYVRPAEVPLQMTPAQIEQMTAEYDTVDRMIEALDAKRSV